MESATRQLRRLEGHRISVALADGSRIDDCNLVSVGRARAGTLWVFTGGQDVFIPFTDVVDAWSAAPARRPAA